MSHSLWQLASANCWGYYGHHLTSLLPSTVGRLLLSGYLTEICILGISLYRLRSDKLDLGTGNRNQTTETTTNYYLRTLITPVVGVSVSRLCFWLLLLRPDYSLVSSSMSLTPMLFLWLLSVSPLVCWSVYQPVMGIRTNQSWSDWLLGSISHFYRHWSFFIGCGYNYALMSVVWPGRGDVGLVSVLPLLLCDLRNATPAYPYVPHYRTRLEDLRAMLMGCFAKVLSNLTESRETALAPGGTETREEPQE